MSSNIKTFIPSNTDVLTHHKIFLLSMVQKNLRIFERAPCLVGNLIQGLINSLSVIDNEEKRKIIDSGTVKYITSYVEKSINCLSSNSLDNVKKLIEKINEEIKDLLFQLKIDGFIDNSELLRDEDVIKIGINPLDYLELVSEEKIEIDCHCFAKFYSGDYVTKVEAFSGDIKFTRYQEVTEAKRGDYIFFFENENGVDRFTHTGVMLDSSTVISKWGIDGCIVKHKIEQTPPIYGNRYLLGRPSCYEGFEKKIRERIHDLREKFMNSPYTSKGLASALLDGIVPENEVDEKIVQSLREATPKEDRFRFLYEMALILSKGFINRSLT